MYLYVSICIPYAPKPFSKDAIDGDLVNKILDEYGIGVFLYQIYDKRLLIKKRAILNRHVPIKHRDKILTNLHPELKTNKAGSIAGKRWTPFKGFCEEVYGIVRRYPGITPIEAASKLKSRFYSCASNASHAIVYYTRMGLIKGVEVINENKRLHLYPKEENS